MHCVDLFVFLFVVICTCYVSFKLAIYPVIRLLSRKGVIKSVSASVSFRYTLNFDHVTDAASRGFPVLACHLATPYDRRCIARFPSVSMSFGYTL